MSKLKAVCKDASTYFHLAVAIQILSALYRGKVPSVLSNRSMVKNGSSCSGI